MHEIVISRAVSILLSDTLLIRTGIIIVLLGLARAGVKMRTDTSRWTVDVPSVALILLGVALFGLGVGY